MQQIVSSWFSMSIVNRPFPSSLVPLFQSESTCETILMKMTLICMRMKLHAELIFIWKVSHLDSFRNRGTRELGNGLLREMVWKLGKVLCCVFVCYFGGWPCTKPGEIQIQFNSNFISSWCSSLVQLHTFVVADDWYYRVKWKSLSMVAK